MKKPGKANKSLNINIIVPSKTSALEILYVIVFRMFYFLIGEIWPYYSQIISASQIRNGLLAIALLLSLCLMPCLTL